jgi:hypothetical protein
MPRAAAKNIVDNSDASSVDSLPAASTVSKVTKKEKETRTVEDIMDALDSISKTAHELRMDLKKVKKTKGSKGEKKGSFPKGETPPQTRPWNDYVATVFEDMKSKAAEGEKVLYKNALQEAKRRRDAGESPLPPTKTKTSKKKVEDTEEEAPKKKASKKKDTEEEAPKKKAKKETEEEAPKKTKTSKKKVEESEVESEAEAPKKTKKKESKAKEEPVEEEPEIEDGELVQWSFKGVEYLRSSAGELWLSKDGEMGKWVGLYDSKTKKIDKKAKEPEIAVE